MAIETVLVAIGSALGTAAAIVGAGWAAFQKAKRGAAETKAAVAEDTRDRSVADGQRIIYEMLNERLKTVEDEVRGVKLYARKLELHISKLERIMRDKGLEVPELILE